MTTDTPARAAFDRVAAHYDARFTHQPIARHLRAEVMRTVLPLLPATGGRVIEVGCGTGEDASALAAKGHSVLATDAAPEMLAHAAQKAGEPGAYETALWSVGGEIPAAIHNAAPCDMVFSNFGAVNCIEDLGAFGRTCEGLIAPGGHLALVVINRWCMMEILLGALRRDRSSMTRRFRKTRMTRLEDGTMLKVQFPSVRAVAAQMGPGFALVRTRPIGVFLPPSEYYRSFQKRPVLLRAALWLDRSVGRLWPVSRLGDHMLILLQRKARP